MLERRHPARLWANVQQSIEPIDFVDGSLPASKNGKLSGSAEVETSLSLADDLSKTAPDSVKNRLLANADAKEVGKVQWEVKKKLYCKTLRTAGVPICKTPAIQVLLQPLHLFRLPEKCFGAFRLRAASIPHQPLSKESYI